MQSAIEEHRAELQRDDAQRQLLQDRRADGGVLAGQAQLRLNQLLPRVQVLLDLARQNLAELGVDAADVAGQGLDRGQQQNHRNGQCAHVRLAFARGLWTPGF
jgi:hypothetical protein